MDFLVNFFKTSLESEIDENLTSHTESMEVIDERAESFQWKLKRISMNFLFRIFQKFSNMDYLNDNNREIAHH